MAPLPGGTGNIVGGGLVSWVIQPLFPGVAELLAPFPGGTEGR